MAEVVFQNLEEQLPVLEELEREGVFTSDEIRTIVKRRTEFEYKLQKRTTEKKDILNYLEYEMKLDALRRKRSHRLKLKQYNVAALGIGRKIHSLFRRGLMKFSTDLNLWMRYIEFCKSTNSVRALSLAFGKLLQQHATNPEVWLMAAKHDIEQMNNFENARLILQKGLRVNKTSEKLWHEYFRLELLHVEKIKKRKQILLDGGLEVGKDEEPEPEKIEDFLQNKTAEIVFACAIKEIKDSVEFRTKFIDISREFEDCDNLEDVIYNSLNADFPDNEVVCEIHCLQPIMQLQRMSAIAKDNDWLNTENEVKLRFDTSVKKLQTSTMYEKYFNCFFKLLKESGNHDQMERRLNVAIDVLERSENEMCITEGMYMLWVELLIQMGGEDVAMQCLERGLERFKNSFSLWKAFLLSSLENGESWEKLRKHFQSCAAVLKDDERLLLWKLYIDVSMDVSEDETRKVFQEAIDSPQKLVKTTFLPQYLKWIEETDGLVAVRRFYEENMLGTADIEFILTCIHIEESQSEKNIGKLRSLYEKLISDHGEDSADVWLSYISFEKTHAQPQDLDNVGKIYLKAKKTLKGKLSAAFISAYSLLV